MLLIGVFPVASLYAPECWVRERADELVMKTKPLEPLQSIIYVRGMELKKQKMKKKADREVVESEGHRGLKREMKMENEVQK